MIKKYKFGFDIWGLLLFLIIMIPNFIWFTVPAPNDILRAESVTPVIDAIGSVLQIVFIATLCILVRVDIDKIEFSKMIIGTLIMVVGYFISWIVYYYGITNSLIIILLTILPCLAFTLYSIDRRNLFAFITIVLFTFCHIIYSFTNFII